MQTLSAFSSIIVYRGGQLMLDRELIPTQTLHQGQELKIRIVTKDVAPARMISISYPSEISTSSSNVQVWMLTWPSRDLYQFDVEANQSEIEWGPEMGNRGCLVLSYENRHGAFMATAPMILEW